ncbi:MAG: DNA-primase RepB domain-containing protein [Vicinamibacterales bacterium]
MTRRLTSGESLQFLRTAYRPDDWIAVLLKASDVGPITHCVVPVSWIARPSSQSWLQKENAHRNIYVSINAITPGQPSRRRRAICAVRHLFLDIDANADGVIAVIEQRRDLPLPSYLVASSPDRAQAFWRVRDFTKEAAEALQKQFARELGGDPAATSCAQMARLPGFVNHKYSPAPLVTIEYRHSHRSYTPSDFPVPVDAAPTPRHVPAARLPGDRLEQARRFLAAIPAAISGQHGDLQTFRVCCRLVRGFALTDADAFRVLSDWNTGCRPPWSERELRDKLRHARQYGREPIGALLEVRPRRLAWHSPVDTILLAHRANHALSSTRTRHTAVRFSPVRTRLHRPART